MGFLQASSGLSRPSNSARVLAASRILGPMVRDLTTLLPAAMVTRTLCDVVLATGG